MRSLLTLRNTLLAVAGAGILLLAGFAVSLWLDAQTRGGEAERILESVEVEDGLLTSAHHWAAERALVEAALSSPQALAPAEHDAIEEHRRHGDAALARVLEVMRSRPDEHAELVVQTEARLGDVGLLRERVEKALERPRMERDGALLEAWFPAITELIMASRRLGTAARYRSRTRLQDIEVLRDLRNAAWVMSEFAEREAALIVGIIAANQPLVIDEFIQLPALHGRIEQAWATIGSYAREESAAREVLEAIEGVREGYFDAFDRRRAPIVIAGLEGAEYPMSAWEWIDQVGEAIAPIRRLGEVAGAVTRQLAVRHAAESKRQMVVSVVILALTLLGGGLSIWVVLRRIVRPISHITRTMTALARGHQIVAVPSTDQIGEIGDMARALQVFKEKAEHEVSGIVEAYTRLQQLSESLMRETSNILSQLELILMEDKQPSDSDRTALAPGATVLLIEGDAAERERLVRLVSDNGHHAVAANGGHQGLGILDDEDVDLVLLALDNPEVDGPAIVAHMHESPRLQGIPIIAVSDAADAEATPSSLDLGTADLLSRSCEPALLMARMEVALERRRLRQREQAYRDRLAAGKKTFEELLRAIEPQLVAAGTRAKEGAFEIGDRDLKLKREIEAVLEDAEQRMAANKSLTTRSLARILARSGKHRFSEQTLRQIIDRRYPPLRRLGIIGHDERTARMPQGGRAIPS